MSMSLRWRIAAAVVFCVWVTVLTLLVALIWAGFQLNEQQGIAVTGTGRVTVVPDVGLLYLGWKCRGRRWRLPATARARRWTRCAPRSNRTA